jgi:hypothetical protein
MNSNMKKARMAGLFYLLYIVTSVIADLFAHLGFGDVETIFNTIVAHEWPFRFGFVIGMLSIVLFLLAAWALYVLLKPVNEDLALLFLILNLGGVAVQSFSMLNLFAGFLLSSGADTLKAFPADQLQALALLFVNIYKNGFLLAQIFYSAWLLPLGYLVYKSGFLPKILGILLILDFFAVLIWFLQVFLLPGYDIIHYPGVAVSFIAEVGLALWLLIMGAKETQDDPNE